MSNLANIQKLHYCDCRSGYKTTCSNVATWQVRMCSKKEKDLEIHLKQIWEHRCDKHKTKSTASKIVYKADPFDQGYALQMINNFLKTIIGKRIHSKFHTARELEVKYLKPNGAVMCFQPITKKWKFVYYNQIESVL